MCFQLKRAFLLHCCTGTRLLRWVNQLRGDLVTGAFTPEEDQRIVELQATVGNKWSSIARELPGRFVRAVLPLPCLDRLVHVVCCNRHGHPFSW